MSTVRPEDVKKFVNQQHNQDNVQQLPVNLTERQIRYLQLLASKEMWDMPLADVVMALAEIQINRIVEQGVKSHVNRKARLN